MGSGQHRAMARYPRYLDDWWRLWRDLRTRSSVADVINSVGRAALQTSSQTRRPLWAFHYGGRACSHTLAYKPGIDFRPENAGCPQVIPWQDSSYRWGHRG